MIKIDCAFDELVAIEKLVPHPRNNNRHSIEQIEALCKLIKAHGFRHSLVVSNRSGFIVAGHGRLEAAEKLGMKELPVDFQDFTSEAEEYQCLTADNEIARWAELDYQNIYDTLKELPEIDVELLGIEDFALPTEEVIGATDEDEVPEVVNPITKRGDIWILGNHRVMCGDSTMIDDIEKLMNGEKADMLLTDPPYNYASETKCSKSNSGNNQLKNAEWDKEFKPEVVPFFDFLNNDYSSYIFTSAFLFGRTFSIAKEFSDFSGMLCFEKSTYNSNLMGRHPTFNIEPIVYSTKGKHIFNYETAEFKNALIRTSGEHFTRFVGHPSQKPEKLISEIIKNSSNENHLVLDLFLGSGTTLIACEKTNRKCYGMELDEKYCDVIVKRWQKYTGKKAYLLKDGEKFAWDDL